MKISYSPLFAFFTIAALVLLAKDLLAGEVKTPEGQTIASYTTSPSTYITLGDVNTGDGTVPDVRFRSAGIDYLFLGPYGSPGNTRLNLLGEYAVHGQTFLHFNAGTLRIGDIHGGDGAMSNLLFCTNDENRVWIDGSGNVGVGGASPGPKLYVKGRSHFEGHTAGQEAFIVDQRVPGVIAQFRRDGSPKVTIAENGDITSTGALEVASVRTKTWTVAPDYVFEKEYKLRTLEDVDSFVKKNKHLPEVPSAKEFKEKGMDLAEMNFLLLKKVEELTLHAIRQDKVIKEQQSTLTGQARRLAALEAERN